MDLHADDFGGAALEGCNEILTSPSPTSSSACTARSSTSASTSSRPTPSARFSVVLAEYGIAERAHELADGLGVDRAPGR